MPTGIEISDEVKSEIIEMRGRGGLMPADIGRELGLTAQTVYRVLKEAGIAAVDVSKNRILRGEPLTSEEIDGMIQEYVADANVGELCDKHEISIPFFYDILREHGVPTRQNARLDKRQKALDDACVMYREGETLVKINEATGLSNFTINREVHKRGIPLRRPRAKH